MTWTLITGGAKNLGAEICRTLASQGHSLAIHYRSSAKLAQDVAERCQSFGVQAEIIQGDFADQKSTAMFIENYLKRFSDTKYVVNNVGNYYIGSILQTPLSQWYALFQNNLLAPLAIIQALAPSLKYHSGAIVNIGVAGLDYADIYAGGYSSAKAALYHMTKSLAKEMAPANVTVNMISPGYLETAVDLPNDLAGLPMQRPANHAEAAQLIAYLLSPAAKYITGQNIEVAGGVRL